jgi:hypothetical protein
MMNAASPPEVRFNVDDLVIVRGRVAVVWVPNMNGHPGNALVAFASGDRELIPIDQLERAPDGAGVEHPDALHERESQT